MRRIVIFLTLSFSMISFSSAQMPVETENYFKLKNLRESGPPRHMKLIMISNMNQNKTIISEGILFTYKSRSAREVEIAGNFSHWRGRPMDKGDNGVWMYFLDDYEGKDTVRYKFCVDGIWTFDPGNPERIDDSAGSFLSTVEPYARSEGKQITFRMLAGNTVEFRLYRPQALVVSIVGDFNHWNPENDLLRKGSDGIWRATKKLTAGWHRYRYLIDGEPSPDIYNPSSASDDAGDLCSLITLN